jgi:mannitol/fructose-specific phosphotransferase system IIA component (Ntr-type)
MTDDDYKWLGESLPAITFESYHGITKELYDVFSNPQYREKLSAAQIVQIIQQYISEGNGGEVVW